MEKLRKHLFLLAAIPAIFMISSLVAGSRNVILRGGVALTCALICVFTVLVLSKGSRVLWFLAAAFCLSIVGDLFLKSANSDMGFILGILFFFLAHIGFLVYAMKIAKLSWLVLAVVTVPFLVFYFIGLAPSPGLSGNIPLSVAALCYLLISCLSFSVAVSGVGAMRKSPARWVFAAGIASLLISDTFLSIVDFIMYTGVAPQIMRLYYLSHVLIALSVTLEYGTIAQNHSSAIEAGN